MSDFIGTPRAAALRDSGWIRTSFLLAEDNIKGKTDEERADLLQWRLETTASQKWTNSRLGGNFSINTIPQYTRYADIRIKGLALSQHQGDTEQNLGMGRFHSEQMDDAQQIIHMQFGMPEYNGMLSFFTSFFDGDASIMASEGRGTIFYYLGRAAGLVVSIAVILRFPVFIMSGFAAKFIFSSPSSKYYYMVPRMPLYWNRVNMIANHLAVNMGLVPRVWDGDEGAAVKDRTLSSDDAYVQYAYRNAPDIFNKDGGVNVYAIANKAQRIANNYYNALKEAAEVEGGDLPSLAERLRKVASTPIKAEAPKPFNEYLEEYHNSVIGNMQYRRTDAITNTDISEQQTAGQAEGTETKPDNKPSNFGSARPKYLPTDSNAPENQPGAISSALNAIGEALIPGYGNNDGFFDYWVANRRDGSDYISFRVNYEGTVNESFSNGVRDSDISQKFNGFSNTARSARFTFSEGKTGIAPLDWVTGAATDLFAGALDGIHMGGLLSLAGSAFVDIPKHWDNSTVSLPTTSYTIELRAPYGNKVSRYMNLYIPLACLLAGTLPISTGKQSYTSPFLCNLFSRGRAHVRLGMIESLTITRGAGNMGWNKNNECLGIDVSLSVVDLSSIAHMPMDPGSLNPLKGLFDEDNMFNDYMAVLGNLSLADQTYPLRKLALALTRKREQYDSFFSKAHFASALDNFWPTRVIGQITGLAMRASERTLGR